MYQFSIGDHLIGWKGVLVDIGNKRLFHLSVSFQKGVNGADGAVPIVFHVKEGGDIDPGDLGKLREKFPFAISFLKFGIPHRPADFGKHLLAIPNHHGVKERCKGFGVETGRSAGENQGERLLPLLAEEGDTGQIKHRQYIGCGEFMLKAETNDVKICEGPF